MNQQEAIEKARKLGYKWVAMDKSKWWSAYALKPIKDKTLWGGSLRGCLLSYLGKDTSGINWEESLAEVY